MLFRSLEFEERTSATGAFTFGARGSGHDDYVSLLLTTAMADAEHRLPGSPSRGSNMLEALRNLSPERMSQMRQSFHSLAIQRGRGWG